MGRPTLSACMIVKNEAHHLPKTLDGVRNFADEIIVVDTGSTDETREIARQIGVQLFEFPWCGSFAKARNVSLQHATCDYIVWIDADDRISPENQEKIKQLKYMFDGNKAFYFILQDVASTGPSYSFLQLRCAPRRDDVAFKGRVHEHLTVEHLPLVRTDIVIEHHGYQEQSKFNKKIRRNLELLEKEREEGRDDEQLYFYLAQSYQHIGETLKAIAAMQESLRRMEQKAVAAQNGQWPTLCPFLPEAHLVLAQLHAGEGDHHSALRHMALASAVAEENGPVHLRIACLYQEMKQHSNAIVSFKKALKGETTMGIVPSKPLDKGRLFAHMAFSFLCMAMQSEALECLKKAWSHGIGIGESWEELGQRALETGQMAPSIQAYEAALKTGELSADGLCNLGLLYSKKGMVQEAASCYAECLRKEPEHQQGLANLAHLNLRMGNLETASHLFHSLLSMGKDDADILLALAAIAARRKDSNGLKRLMPDFSKRFADEFFSKRPRDSLIELSSSGEAFSKLTAVPYGIKPSGFLRLMPSDAEFFKRLAANLKEDGKNNLSAWSLEVASFLDGRDF